MANLFTMYLKAKGRKSDLATLKRDVLKHCNLMTPTAPDTTSTDYWVDLAAWNPDRQDWVKEPLGWWLELRNGQSELLPVKDGQLYGRITVGRWGAPPTSLMGCGKSTPRAGPVRKHNRPDQRYSSEVEMFSRRDLLRRRRGSVLLGRRGCVAGLEGAAALMIDNGKPVAEELLEFTGTRFVMVDGVPLSLACGRAKDHNLCSCEQRPLSELPVSDLGKWRRLPWRRPTAGHR